MSDKELIVNTAKDIFVKLLDHPKEIGLPEGSEQLPKLEKTFADLLGVVARVIKSLDQDKV
jgi:hypothetical protein